MTLSDRYSRFLSSYYVSSAIVLSSFFAVRSLYLEEDGVRLERLGSTSNLHRLESQAGMLLGIMAVIKFVRRQSLDGFVSDMLFFSKSVIMLLCWYMDTRLLVVYGLVFLGLAMVLPQPFYNGPSKMTYFTPASFHEVVEKGDGETEWIIEFFAHWSPQCLALEPVIAELSTTYATQKLHFGKMDVSRWPTMAKKYNIDINGMVDQLPTLVKFSGKGKEVSRIPHISDDGKVAKGKFRKGDIQAAFNLK